MNNAQIIAKSGVNTGITNASSALLPPEKAKEFFRMMMEDNSILKKMTWSLRKSLEGSIPLLGVGEELLRAAVEGEDTITGNEVMPILGEIPYSIKKMKLGTSITEDWFEENIENEAFEDDFIGMIVKQCRNDVLNLSFNGDESSTSPFYNINDGFIKQLKASGNVINAATINGGVYTDDYYLEMLAALEDKYINDDFIFIQNKQMSIQNLRFLKKRPTPLGDEATLKKMTETHHGYDVSRVAKFPNNTILLCDPKNLHIVYTYEIKLRKTTEGKEAVYNDKRFYAIKLNADFIILDKNACVLLINGGNLPA